MNDKNAWSKSSIPRNDEPTRFLTKEEMEQLEQGTFQDNKADIKTETVEKKSANIKIEELPPKEEIQPEHKNKTKTRLKKYIKRLCLITVFIIAGIAGFYLSFSWSLHNQSEQNAKEYDVKQLEYRQQKLSEQQSDLENELARLEKDELSKQYDDATQEKSFLVEVLDKITGKDKEDKAMAENLQTRINELEQTLYDINLQLDDLKNVETQVHDLKVVAERELAEHKDLIEIVKFQAQNIINDFLHK